MFPSGLPDPEFQSRGNEPGTYNQPNSDSILRISNWSNLSNYSSAGLQRRIRQSNAIFILILFSAVFTVLTCRSVAQKNGG